MSHRVGNLPAGPRIAWGIFQRACAFESTVRAVLVSPAVSAADLHTREAAMSTAQDKGGVVFVGCGQQAAPGATPRGRRREVVVGGRRVRTVDIHAHCAVPEALALVGEEIEPALRMSTPEDRLRAMDE